jgi:subtilisin-like proprotein convertase family protein
LIVRWFVLEVSTDNTKYVFREQSAGQDYNLKIATKSFEKCGRFKYLGMTVTNQNYMHKEIKNRLNTENVC